MFGRRAGGSAEAAWSEHLQQWARRELASGGSDLFGRAQEDLERVLIDCALEHTGGQRQKAAELLGLGRNTLTRKLQKFDSEDDDQNPAPTQAAGGT
jgi:two-component system nitrogen regulation response regulator GlnG